MPAMQAMRARCADVAVDTVCALVGLVTVVIRPCAAIAAAFPLFMWALGREEETPASSQAMTACDEFKIGCVLAAFWRSRHVLGRLVFLSFCLSYLVLYHDDNDEGLEEEVREDSRGRALASPREHPVRRPTGFATANDMIEEQERRMANGTARRTPVLL